MGRESKRCPDSEVGRSMKHSRTRSKAREWERGLEGVRLRGQQGPHQAGLLGRDLEINLGAMEESSGLSKNGLEKGRRGRRQGCQLAG